ncbi:MAG: hypothetical protein WCY88_15265 [Spongiibacteraceae bacterium]
MLIATLTERDLMFITQMLRLMDIMTAIDHSKAERDLGWQSEPILDSVRKTALFY